VLSAEDLSRPRSLAVNYHDGPLPRYAGMHATTWALLGRETSYAVTWHVATDRIDAGDILLQRAVDIQPDETAFSLNLKCYAAALASFEQLVDRLVAGNLKGTPQGLDARSYFAASKRPPANGCLDFKDTAQNLSTLVRALSFGSSPNPLVLPKVAFADDFILVG
jgi:methionyl-tRNA formyltransferase